MDKRWTPTRAWNKNGNDDIYKSRTPGFCITAWRGVGVGGLFFLVIVFHSLNFKLSAKKHVNISQSPHPSLPLSYTHLRLLSPITSMRLEALQAALVFRRATGRNLVACLRRQSFLEHDFQQLFPLKSTSNVQRHMPVQRSMLGEQWLSRTSPQVMIEHG